MTFILITVIFFSWKPPILVYNIWDDPVKNFQIVVGPSLALGVGMGAFIARMARTQLLEVFREDYVRTARAKGLGEQLVMWRHVVRNALLPVFTLSGLQFAFLLGGSVAVEQAFSVPGLGRALIGGIQDRDWTIIQNLVLLYAIVFVLINLVVDLAYGIIDLESDTSSALQTPEGRQSVSQITGQALENLQTRRKGRVPLLYENATRFARSSTLGAGAAVFLVLIALIAVFAGFLAPSDPNAQNYSALLQTPSWDFPMGTDSLGRDTLSRVISGTQLSLIVSVSAVGLSKLIGFTWGIVSGYVGGRFDLLSQRLLDVLISFPSVILALLLLVALGAGVNTVIIAIAATGIAGTTRIIRSVALLVRESEYVLAARMIGGSPVRVMLRHVAPQCVAPLLVVASASLGGAIFTEAALSYLGLGIPPPDPSWGNMLGGILVASFKPPWWLVVFPGCAITLTILAFNLFGDALRDHLDPRLRGRLE